MARMSTDEASWHTAVLEVLESRMGGEVWDALPAVWLIRDRDGVPELEEVRLPRRVLRRHPVQFLDELAAGIRTGLRERPGGARGVALMCEGWGLLPGKANPAEAERYLRGELGLISDHPDRTEVRMVYALDQDGTRFMAMRERGSDRADRWTVPAGAGPAALDGRVPDALARLMDAIMERQRGQGAAAAPPAISSGLRRQVSMNGVTFKMTDARRKLLAAVVDAPAPLSLESLCRVLQQRPLSAGPALSLLCRAGLVCRDVGAAGPGGRYWQFVYRAAFDRRWYRHNGLLPGADASPEAEP